VPALLAPPAAGRLTQKMVQCTLRRLARRANVNAGVHILRHTFCSHLAMRGAPARAIQELAGHQDLTTTMRYMHVSPAAIKSAIELLDGANWSGEIVEAAGTECSRGRFIPLCVVIAGRTV
jgi:site-specific recombinase XerD